MTTSPSGPDFHDAQLLPLTTEGDIERRVADLVGRANSRQLWLMFLDDLDLQLPLVIPIEGLPFEPTREQVDGVVETVCNLMGEIGAISVITVIERYAPAVLSSGDLVWARLLRRSLDGHGVELRAQLLSHRTGVRLIGADELAES